MTWVILAVMVVGMVYSALALCRAAKPTEKEMDLEDSAIGRPVPLGARHVCPPWEEVPNIVKLRSLSDRLLLRNKDQRAVAKLVKELEGRRS